MRLFTIVLVWGVSLPAFADPPHCLGSCPTGAPNENQTIKRTLYTLSNNPITKFADWVAYKVEPANLNTGSTSRVWKADPVLGAGNTIVPTEYDDASRIVGIDRGHQAPLGSFKSHPEWPTTNYLSNITPQFTYLNQGAWKSLEDAVRAMVKAKSVVAYVVTGPLYEWRMPKLPATDKDHRIPSSYWKVIAVDDPSGVRVAAFYFYQSTPYKAKYCDSLKTVDFIERKSGLSLLSGIANEGQIEAGEPRLAADLGCTPPFR